MLYDAALVLEGGAFWGQYTAGVVDAFLAHHIEFRSVIGVSAGSLCGANFVSKQYERPAMINIHHRHDRDYISITHLLHRQSIINLDYLFEGHGWQWLNFNDEAYRRSASHFTAVATRLTDGKADLHRPGRRRLDPGPEGLLVDADHLQAPADQPGPLHGRRVADSIPYDVAERQGYKKIVIVRTRDINYRKKPTSRALDRLFHRYYPDYSAFVKAAIARPAVYNQQVEEVNRRTKEKEFFTIAPQHPVKISRIEDNTKKLVKLYETGKQEANLILPQLIKYLDR